MKSSENPVCQTDLIDEEKVNAVRNILLPDEAINRLAETFKELSDFTRLKILLALYTRELCVCEIAELTGVSVSAVSHQLRTLKDAKLVKFKRNGKMVFYSLDDDHIHKIVEAAAIHSKEYDD